MKNVLEFLALSVVIAVFCFLVVGFISIAWVMGIAMMATAVIYFGIAYITGMPIKVTKNGKVVGRIIRGKFIKLED